MYVLLGITVSMAPILSLALQGSSALRVLGMYGSPAQLGHSVQLQDYQMKPSAHNVQEGSTATSTTSQQNQDHAKRATSAGLAQMIAHLRYTQQAMQGFVLSGITARNKHKTQCRVRMVHSITGLGLVMKPNVRIACLGTTVNSLDWNGPQGNVKLDSTVWEQLSGRM